jgi:hypothetical protein
MIHAFEVSYDRKEKMAIPYLQIIALIVAAILLAACASVLTSTPVAPTAGSPVFVSGTPTAPPAASPSPQATYTTTAVPATQPAAAETQIRVTIGDTVLTGRLWDNATARDLITQLPVTLTFRDFNELEKISQLPRKLSMDGVPAGDDPFPRDIGYYAPSGDLVFYYGDVGYFNGIVRIGQFDGNMDAIMSQADDFSATIELVK